MYGAIIFKTRDFNRTVCALRISPPTFPIMFRPQPTHLHRTPKTNNHTNIQTPTTSLHRTDDPVQAHPTLTPSHPHYTAHTRHAHITDAPTSHAPKTNTSTYQYHTHHQYHRHNHTSTSYNTSANLSANSDSPLTIKLMELISLLQYLLFYVITE